MKYGGNLGDPIIIMGVILVSIREEITNPHFGLRFINRNCTLVKFPAYLKSSSIL